MHKSKDVICRNPKCHSNTVVYINGDEPEPESGLYVFKCPRCGKEVPFPSFALGTAGDIPGGSIVASAWR